ncbi:unnamed protein product, partial [Meganyctiphanes norvegica]
MMSSSSSSGASRMVRVPLRAERKKRIPPDGGWGWVVVAGTCLTLFCVPAIQISYGVLFQERLDWMSATHAEFSLIANTMAAINCFTTLLMAPLTELFGYRSVTVLGGFVSFLAMILSANAHNVLTFVLAYSLLGGISMALSTFAGIVIIPKYFERHKGFANGLVSSASAVAKIVMPVFVRFLLDEYNFYGACLILAAITLHTCLAGLTYHPPEWHYKTIPSKAEVQRETKLEEGKDVTITDNGIVDRYIINHKPTVLKTASAEDEEDENVLYITPTTPKTNRRVTIIKEDEVVLFTKCVITNCNFKGLSVTLRQPYCQIYPSEMKVFDDGDLNPSCCDSFIVVKVFRMLKWNLLQQWSFHLLAWPNAFAFLAYLNIMFILPGYIHQELGYSKYHSATIISIFAATEVFARLIFSWLSDYPAYPKALVYTLGWTINTCAIAAMTWHGSFAWVAGCLVVYATSLSASVTLLIHLALQYLGNDLYDQFTSFLTLISGVVIFIGGPIFGWVQGLGGAVAGLWLAAVLQGVAAAIWITHLCFSTIRARYSKLPTKQNP